MAHITITSILKYTHEFMQSSEAAGVLAKEKSSRPKIVFVLDTDANVAGKGKENKK